MRSYAADRLGRNRPRDRSRIRLAKSANRRRPNFRALAELFLCAMLVSSGVAFSVQTPMLAVREVRVRGVRLANRKAVEQSARLALGRNILLVPSRRICRSVSAIPEVSAVRLDRRFPDRVDIILSERKPIAAVLNSGKAYLVQPDGYVFHAGAEQAPGVPVIRLARPIKICVGGKCNSEEVVAAITVVKTAAKNELRVAGISIDHMGDMCLNMCGGLRVKLGQPDSLGEKMAVLRSALACKPGLAYEAQYIDVTCPKFPVYRPKSDGV